VDLVDITLLFNWVKLLGLLFLKTTDLPLISKNSGDIPYASTYGLIL